MSRTILFDLDGTLVDTAPDLWEALNLVFDESGIEPIPFDRIRGLVGQGALVMIERGLKERGLPVERERVKAMHVRFLAHYEANIANRSRPFPGVETALDALAENGDTLAVCTNKYEGLSVRLLEALDLAGRFAAICGPDTFGVRKPDPDHIRRTVQAAGGALDRAIMIGDSATDINAAKAAAIPVIAVPFGYTDTPVAELGPDRIVDHFDALTEAIDQLLPVHRGA